MTDRTILVIPVDRVAGLDIPPLAVDTGGSDPEWVDWPIGSWPFRRAPSLRLPLSPEAAAKVRRRLRVAPYLTAAHWTVVLGYLGSTVLFHRDAGPGFPVVPMVLLALMTVLSLAAAPKPPVRQAPRRQYGRLCLEAVPGEVARLWWAANPGLRDTPRFAPRRYPRRFYALSGGALIAASILLGVLLTNDGRENPEPLYPAVPLLFLVGIGVTGKVLPPGYIRFDRSGSA
ncbi:hypothetical protein [Actinoplanes teichomyceticus]|uniref:Uncharacterized protein n=1 Tax=Actinoplanes teichomyceticus TaxID=1867 RepID=A0A561WL73_ACTTI|nr:hypothetical protein [Actinoplanes teichomyceticus]TWG24614.1 hypothetical protein FHX34_1021174 [Actinoplanes teichomyceticus]GIF14723.1 hypothetical protein Ate01nite_47550 [Actinoplanes teichomyceticus]